MYQITNYNWLSVDKLNIIVEEMKKLNISSRAEFEYPLQYGDSEVILSGIIDCIDDDNIYEFKCVDKLENIHILQLAIYMYLYESKEQASNNYLLNLSLFKIL